MSQINQTPIRQNTTSKSDSTFLSPLLEPPISVTCISNKLQDVRFDYRVEIDRFTARQVKGQELEQINIKLPDCVLGKKPQFNLYVEPKTRTDTVMIGLDMSENSFGRKIQVHYQISALNKRGEKKFSQCKLACFTF